MEYSKAGLALTERFEGCRFQAYYDSTGRATIGYGHTEGVNISDTCTQAQATAWLIGDVATAETAVNQLVHVPLTQNEFDALVDFVFNLGAGNFEHSTMLRRLNASDYAGAALEFSKWDRAGGIEVAGILRRRQAEAAEFTAA